jgi:phage/conjugal plasmid C-4 type zinc finger TraR family protein
MSDWADIAAEREQQLRDDALAEHSRRMQSACSPTVDWPGLDRRERVRHAQDEHDGHAGKRQAPASAENCAVCEEPIPDARRQAVPGVQTCIECQRELESAVDHPSRRTHPHGR